MFFVGRVAPDKDLLPGGESGRVSCGWFQRAIHEAWPLQVGFEQTPPRGVFRVLLTRAKPADWQSATQAMVTLWLLSEHRFGRAGKRRKEPQSAPFKKGDIGKTTVK